MRVYRPAPSRGRLWVVLFVLFSLTFCVIGVSTGSVLVFLFGAAMAAVFVVWLSRYPTMRYELDATQLILRCGPFRYVIPIRDIQRVTRQNLTLGLLAGMRLPGFAVGKVYYGQGMVHMCVTRALQDIVLIETSRHKYGITPADEEQFLADLQAKLEGGPGQ